jgi:anaerobic magnesium-protoporphyrin IX monomethyl ester cyclase
MCKQAGITAHASFMVGLPGETKETLEQTDKLARSLNILYGYHYLAPFPGTSVREKIEQYDLEILTDDWAKYDANDAIVKTSALEPEDMREFVASYDEEIDTDWQKILSGYKNKTSTPMENMRLEGHWRMNLTYQVLKNDLIEKVGFIEPALFHGSKDSALRELCKRIIVNTSADSRIVNDTISDFANRGYLQTAISDQGCNWRWA